GRREAEGTSHEKGTANRYSAKVPRVPMTIIARDGTKKHGPYKRGGVDVADSRSRSKPYCFHASSLCLPDRSVPRKISVTANAAGAEPLPLGAPLGAGGGAATGGVLVSHARRAHPPIRASKTSFTHG